jgi:uncharacterized protein (DUF2336 family)
VHWINGEGNDAPAAIYGLRWQNSDSSSVFDDLDAALQSGSSEKRVAMLRKVTNLFLSEANRLNEEQIGIFDDVLVQLIERIETRTLVEISERLAPVANAPIDLTLNLARHSEIGIARPILTQSSRLTTAELVEIAKTRSQDHLLAISERGQIETAVTDVLLDRGNQAVVHSVAGNSGAKFSENGFAALLRRPRPMTTWPKRPVPGWISRSISSGGSCYEPPKRFDPGCFPGHHPNSRRRCAVP